MTGDIVGHIPATRWRPSAWRGGIRSETLAVSAMVALFVLLHGTWFIKVPGDLDAFNFVLGVRRFDVAQHRPHPPGAPVYVAAGKAATRVWRSLGLPAHSLAGPEPAALGALSLVAGTLCIVLAWRILQVLDAGSPRALHATILIASTPLLWIAASRQLSDVAGVLLVLAVYSCLLRRRLHAASLLAGIAIGLRVQTALLTIPALAVSLARAEVAASRRRTAAAASGWLAAGIGLWLVPLIVASGARRYWTAVTVQAKDDLSSSIVLAATPTLRNVFDALFNTFARPWGTVVLAAVILAAAVVGAVRLQRTSRPRAFVLLICSAPYLLFHLTFHETATVRYALPVVLVLAYLAAVALEAVPQRWRRVVFVLLVTTNLFVSVRALNAYRQRSSPAMALLDAMYRRAGSQPPAFVTSHSNVMLPRLQQVVTRRLPWRTASPPAPYEWRAMIEHWRKGATAPVWFIADPRRTDLSLIDRRSQQILGAFTLNRRARWTVNGLRPKALVWRELRPPAWIAVQGFALTPEIGGLAERDHHGPPFGGAIALIRRFPTGAVLSVAGRHVGDASDPPVRVAIEIDGRTVSTLFASTGQRHYGTLVHVRPDQLQGDGPYASATVRSIPLGAHNRHVPVTVEHFDYQPAEEAVFAFGSGWHEPELRPATGETWRWATRRATLLVHRAFGAPVELKFAGDIPPLDPSELPEIDVTGAGEILDAFLTWSTFSRQIIVPRPTSPDACDVEITIASTVSMVPAEDGESADGRELAFRVVALEVGRHRQ